MSDDPTKLSDSDNSVLTTGCACGGCGTGTVCATDRTGIKMSAASSVYSYAAPDVYSPSDAEDPFRRIAEDTFGKKRVSDDVEMRATLEDEIVKDLLTRVQKLEEKVESLQEENLDLRGSLDALVDIMDEEDDAPNLTWDDLVACIGSQTTGDGVKSNFVAFLDQLLSATNAKD